MQCRGCEHWGDRLDEGEEFRACRAIVEDRSLHSYSASGLPPDVDAEDLAEREAWRSSHRAAVKGDGPELVTRADFGCVLFEPRGA